MPGEFTAQPLEALPLYGCGVPLAGSDRLWQLQIWRYFRRMCKAPKLVIARRPKADVAISGRQLRFRRRLPHDPTVYCEIATSLRSSP